MIGPFFVEGLFTLHTYFFLRSPTFYFARLFICKLSVSEVCMQNVECILVGIKLVLGASFRATLALCKCLEKFDEKFVSNVLLIKHFGKQI